MKGRGQGEVQASSSSSSSSSAQGCGNKKAPIFLFLPQEMAPHTAGSRQKAENCDTFSPFPGGGNGEEGERLCCCTTRRRLTRVSSTLLVRKKEGEKKKKRSTKQARARSPRHGGTHHSSSGGGSDGSVSLGMCACHTRPSEEWRRSRERGRREGAAGWWWRGQRDLWSSSSSGIPTLGCTPSSSAAEWCPSRRQTQTGCSLCLLHM